MVVHFLDGLVMSRFTQHEDECEGRIHGPGLRFDYGLAFRKLGAVAAHNRQGGEL